MSSGDIAELPREHIFTLVLFLRDQTWGNAELLAVPPTEHLRQAGRVFPMLWLLVMCCAPLAPPPSPGPAKEVLATQPLEQTSGFSFLCVIQVSS